MTSRPVPIPHPGAVRDSLCSVPPAVPASARPGHLGCAVQAGAAPGEAGCRAGGCAGADPGREREVLQSSQQPNFRVGLLLFLELSSSSARLVGRPRGLLGLRTRSSTSGTSPSSHATWTTGARSVHRCIHMGISSTCPVTPIALQGSYISTRKHLPLVLPPCHSCPPALRPNISLIPSGLVTTESETSPDSANGLGSPRCEEVLGDEMVKFTFRVHRHSWGTCTAPGTDPWWFPMCMQGAP